LFLGLNIDMLNLMSRSTDFDLANVKSKSWDGFLIENSHITSIGNLLYSNLFILLIVTSLILLLAMVGTIVVTVRRNPSAIKSTIDDINLVV
jgi:NADH-ubiquinone oxidoreductase chain 6